MKRVRILILEDNADRISAFREAVAKLGDDIELRIWHDAPTMIAEAEDWLERAALISLDHDLNPMPGATGDPGDGLDVAKYLASLPPACPVILHTSNVDRLWSMHNEFRFGGWQTERVGPIGDDWIPKFWLSKAREMIKTSTNTWPTRKSADHAERMERASLSLMGLGLGDALGEMLSYRAEEAPRRLKENLLPGGPWFHTDDTEMAISIVEVLRAHGFVHQDALARRFMKRFERDPDRGYGRMTRIQLREMLAGAKWQDTAQAAFGGQGSMGNGAAMRVAPLGAFYADDPARIVDEATASSVVTHAHPEGVAGAIAVALAAGAAWRLRDDSGPARREAFFDAVIDLTPESKTRRGILLAAGTPADVPIQAVAKTLGNGFLVTAPDTVPYALWCAANHLDDFVPSLADAICTGGDCDTNAAIVGGIVALSVGLNRIPSDWVAAREPMDVK